MKILLLVILLAIYLFSAPAYNALREFTQADGTVFIAKGQGDQHLNWIETEGGEILRYNNQSKNYEYAEVQNSEIKASGRKFEKQNQKRATPLQQTENLFKKSINELWKIKREEAQKRRHIKH